MPKPNTASTLFRVHAFPLQHDVTVKLVTLLGYDPNETADLDATANAIRNTELALGFFLDGEQHLDHLPRPVDYVNASNKTLKDATRLTQTLSRSSEFFRDQLVLTGQNVAELEDQLRSLVEACGSILNTYTTQSSKGARKNTALTITVGFLRRIFRKDYRGKRTGRAIKGAFQFRAEEEKRELEFVESALRAARITAAGYNLEQLFRDPRCAPPTQLPAGAVTQASDKKATRTRTRK